MVARHVKTTPTA